MKEYRSIPVTPRTKRRVHDLRYELRVDSYDEAVSALVEAYHRHEQEDRT